MNGQSCRWRRQLAVRGLWALVLGVSFAPAHARAGCGEGFLPLHAAGPTGRTATSSDPPRPAPIPCRGPSCSRIPLSPPAVPASLPVHRPDDAGALAPLPPLVASDPLFRLIDGAPVRPVRRSTDVYHPPR